MSDEIAQEKEILYELLKAYGEAETAQSPENAATDNQLKSLALHFEEYVRGMAEGTVLDVGCGRGVLLEKLSLIPAFNESRRWIYIGTDLPTHHEELLTLSTKLRLHRRTDFLPIDNFYRSWVSELDVARPLLVVVRNVLHELDIEETSQLLHTLQTNISNEDALFIQDLLVFPHSERGNACWDTTCLKTVLSSLGFKTLILSEPSKSGAQWFSAKLTIQPSVSKLQQSEVREIVIKGRMDQLRRWRKVGKMTLPHQDQRHSKLALIDFDLQRVSLYEQLVDAQVLFDRELGGVLTPSVEDAFSLAVSSYDPKLHLETTVKFSDIQNFRDRANSQDAMEAFLVSDAQVVVIRGGALCGKTTLVLHVLKRRAHGRVPVMLDCTATPSVWPLLENYLLGIGCISSLDVLRNSSNCKFENITTEFQRLISLVAPRTIVVFDHFECLMDPNGKILNDEVRIFLKILADNSDAKLIVTSRFEPNLEFFPSRVRFGVPQPPVGRFPEGDHTENLLDDFVDRATLGIQEYPRELLEAIDRFPYMATIVGKLISKEGSCALDDPEVIQIIKLVLYDVLTARLETATAQPALKLGAMLRIPSPRILFHGVVGKEVTDAAEQTGLLYNVPDRHREDLLECAWIIKNKYKGNVVEEDYGDENKEHESRAKHSNIANWYMLLDKDAGGDPRWIREGHYHTLASGDASSLSRFGNLYGAELLWAGSRWFKYREYEAACEALLAAENLKIETYESRRLLASCMIRTKKKEEGKRRYEHIIKEFSSLDGPKTSYIDSILSLGEYQEALDLLATYELDINSSNNWIAGQYGRAYIGLHRYREAVDAFLKQLKRYVRPDAIIYIRIAQCYYRLGEREKIGSILNRGLKAHPTHPGIVTLYCANLIADGTPESIREAEERIDMVLKRFPHNAFALLKIIKIYEITNRGSLAQKRLQEINWQVDPPHLEGSVRVAVSVAKGDYEQALKQLEAVNAPAEYREALFRRIHLSQIRKEGDKTARAQLAQNALNRYFPERLETNIPMLAMQVQLSHFAGNNRSFNRFFEMIKESNPAAAERLLKELENFEGWDDAESLM